MTSSPERGQVPATALRGGYHTPDEFRGKRKLIDEPNSQSSHFAITGTSSGTITPNTPGGRSVSSQQGNRVDEESHPSKRRSLHHKATETDSKTTASTRDKLGSEGASNPPRARSFAEMYTFRAKNAAAATTIAQQKQNGIVDLTGLKGSPSSPIRNGTQNGLHKSTFNPHQGPKKLLVKNIKSVVKEDKNTFFERKWQEQDAALDKLFRDENAKLLLEELYKGAEYVCRQGLSKELYDKLRQKCIQYLDDGLRMRMRSKAESASTVETLQAFVDTWMLWQIQLQTIRHIYFYLNQTYLVRSAEDADLDTMGLQLFRSRIFEDVKIKKEVLAGAVQLFDHDRQGTIARADTTLAKQAISTFHDLGIYTTDFEPDFLSSSKIYFESWLQTDAKAMSLPQYVQSCSSLLDKELTRCDDWGMDRGTKEQLSSLFDESLIEKCLTRLTVEDDLLDMFEGDMNTELQQTYTLLKRNNHQQELSGSFAKFIETEGSTIVFDEKQESEMVVRLLAFKRKLDHFNKFAFQDNESLGNTLHKAFEIFMNKTKKSQSNWDTDNAKPGEMIAKHVDLLLKGGPKAVPGLRKIDTDKAEEEQDFDNEGNDETEVEKHLDDALDLFRFVHGKAVFEAFYKKDLARRLLMGRTQSFDAERGMLTRLKNECGAGFTHNLESMFKDMDLAREEMKSYNQLLSDRGFKASPDISVNVLSVAAWPTYPDVPVNLPTSISKAQANFERHYKEKHVGRKLAWKPALAHCQLKSYFPKGNKEIVVSGFQAVVLLLFNDLSDNSKLSYADIKSATSLPDAELVRTLQSLACAKYRVLSKSPKGREVNTTDTFTFNSSFTDSKLRIKINQIQLKETKEENKETHERVAADRHYETQAAIVRIMKSRKVIGHNELIVEVIKATRSRGVLDQGDIKKNIEKLIEKEYMERDEDVKNGYKYLA